MARSSSEKQTGVVARFRAWRAKRDAAWESLCTGCGLCCYERDALPFGRVRIRRFSACRFLDERTHRCTVYDHRFAVCSYCAKVRLFHAVFDPTMPPSCGYVQRYRPSWLRRRLAEPVADLLPPTQQHS